MGGLTPEGRGSAAPTAPQPGGTTPGHAPAADRGPPETAPTEAHSGPAAVPAPPPGPEPEGPLRLGRYRLGARLGAGGFGVVYRGYDEELRREVAVKLPHRHRLVSPADLDTYLAEARVLASLDHPGIVPIYDFGRTEDGGCYLVSKFIAGDDLAARLRKGRPAVAEAAAIVAAAAEALHHAHRRGLVHRDVKPGNILLGPDGSPVVVDFGLALREEEFGTGPTCLGTPGYMSPEQAREEGHLVDGRSDVYSLGVVLYELLTGHKPFRAEDRAALLEQLRTQEPRPPRQLCEAVPRELDRVCLKALSRRPSDRYSTALDLAQDLRHFLAGRAPAPGAAAEGERARVVPKGLRAFDEEDAAFFLSLLPGPRDREGLPDSVRFWKARLEETDPDKTFRVGLLYGPSGCGKSSLVKAGLLPYLSDHVWPVYVEATPAGTEARLLRALRQRCPDLPAGLPLVESLTRLRRGRGLPGGGKVVLLLDQFEQWLHATRDEPNRALVQALRQCDGGRVQCVVLVRDDYWMTTTRFMRELEVLLLEGRNSAAVDLFEPRHARKVLASFGEAFGALPGGEPGAEQARFLDQAVAQLSEEGKVVPVRLSLFAEMVKGRPWTPATLAAVGGAHGVGVAFLEETFSSRGAPPEHRRHEPAARAVLRALLPEQGSDIKGRMQPHEALLAASGYEAAPQEFEALLNLLDTELRLITPAERSDQSSAGPEPAGTGQRYYQLTHDYLVQALRQWLTARQRETRRGRAGLRLGEQAAFWVARPERRYLPSAWEWAEALLLTRRREWSEPQRRMMAAATRLHAGRAAAAAALLFLTALAGLALRGWSDERGRRGRADELVSRLLVADIAQVPGTLAELDGYRAWVAPQLERLADDPARPPRERLRASLALAPADERRVAYLLGRLLEAPPDDLLVIRARLQPRRDELVGPLWRAAEGGAAPPGRRLRAAAALAAYDAEDERWDAAAGPVARQLVKEDLLLLPHWLAALAPAREHLLAPLAALYRGPGTDPAERAVATGILADYAADNPNVLAELVKDADARQYARLIGKLEAYPEEAVAAMEDELGRAAAGADKERLAERQANAAVTLFRAGKPERVWPLLRQSPDPRLRSLLLHAFAALGAEPGPLAERWAEERDVSARRAILLALGEYGQDRLAPGQRERLVAAALRAYKEGDDPGTRGAAEWLLRRWGAGKRLDEVDRAPRARKPDEGRAWYVNGVGHTMVRVGPADGDERPFAVATKETSIAQFLRFRPDYYHLAPAGREGDYPVNVVSWFDAAAYCRWLSEQEGVREDQMCYPPQEEIKPGMRLPADYLRRTGYRLPTEAEWEQAARAGAATSRYYGEADTLLEKYAWYRKNSDGRPGRLARLKPNDLGLFDMLGNTMEWCHGSADAAGRGEEVEAVRGDTPRAARGGGFDHKAGGVRCTQRDTFPASTRWHSISFRVARTCPPAP